IVRFGGPDANKHARFHSTTVCRWPLTPFRINTCQKGLVACWNPLALAVCRMESHPICGQPAVQLGVSQIERRVPQRTALRSPFRRLMDRPLLASSENVHPTNETKGFRVARNGIRLIVERVLLRVGGHP